MKAISLVNRMSAYCRWSASALALIALADSPAFCQENSASSSPVQSTELNIGKTALDHYVAAPDNAYKWNLVETKKTDDGVTYFLVDMKSQTWLRPDEVNRTLWQHWLRITKPEGVQSNRALLFIGGGSNNGRKPGGPDERFTKIAMATQSVVAELGMIPNQPLIFHGDGKRRKEDDLIAYTWDHFLKTGDERWPARLPMVKSVVRAMDTVQALMRGDDAGNHKVDQFVVAGGSKRGWTTWMTAAVDARVVAIMPIVIDVLNLDVSMRHHYSAYGFWAPAIGDYENHKIMHRRHQARYLDLIKLVDPFAYRDRYSMPKCVINSTGDQFFLPDSSQFYFDELPGEKHLCYVPNTDHSLDGSNVLDTIVAFHYCIVNDVPRPEFSWEYLDDNVVRVQCKTDPKQVILWQAVNPESRDFRVDTIGRAYNKTELPKTEDNVYRVEVDVPNDGWKAYFVQLVFDVGAPTPLRLSTPVQVTPEYLPFADKEPPVLKER